MKLISQVVLCLTFVQYCFALPTATSSSLSSSETTQEEKPEAFLVHLKPKAGSASSSASKFLLLLRLPDGSTQTISTGLESETLSSEGSSNSESVPEVEETSRDATQQLEDESMGFEEQQRDVSSPLSSGYGASHVQQKTHHEQDDAHDAQHHQQHETQHKTSLDVAQHEAEHHTPQHHAVHTDSQQHEQQTRSNSYPDEQQSPLEQIRESPAAYGAANAASTAGTSYGSSSAITNYPANDERQVPVILIALPPEASPISQRQRLNKLLGALGQSTTTATAGTKGGALRTPSSYSPAAAPLTDSYSRPASAAATKGGRTAAAAAQPTGGFGGYGNSHTPSPAGGYGSLAMRLAAKGIKAPTAKDVERPEQLKAIISPVQRGRLATKGGSGTRTETHVHRDTSGRPHVDVHVESPAAHPDGGSHSRGPASGTKGGSRPTVQTETHVHRDASGRPHVDVHVESPAAHPDGGSHSRRPASGTKGAALSAPASYSAPSAPLTDSYARPQSAAAIKGGAARATAAAKGALKTARHQTSQIKDATKSLSRPSPAAIVKGRNRAAAAAAPAYSSSNNYPTRVEEQESPRSIEEETRPVFDDEVDDGLPSKVVNSYENSETVAAAPAETETSVSVPNTSSAASDKKVESSLQASTGRYSGKRLVLLLFNRGELDPAVAESAVEAAIARSGNF